MVKLLTGNELLRGDVLWWDGDGWSLSIDDAVAVENGEALIAQETPGEKVSDLALIDAERAPYKDQLEEKIGTTESLLYRRGNFQGTWDDLICDAIVHKPVRVATRLGITGQVLHAVVPRVAQIIMNTTFRMFPDSGAAQHKAPGALPSMPSADQIAFQQFMRGIYF